MARPVTRQFSENEPTKPVWLTMPQGEDAEKLRFRCGARWGTSRKFAARVVLDFFISHRSLSSAQMFFGFAFELQIPLNFAPDLTFQILQRFGSE